MDKQIERLKYEMDVQATLLEEKTRSYATSISQLELQVVELIEDINLKKEQIY
jgi:hypothetical protein